MILTRHDIYPDHAEVAVQLDADATQEASLATALAHATVTRDVDDDGADQPTVTVALTWGLGSSVDGDTPGDDYLNETKLLIEAALARVSVDAPEQGAGVGSPL